MTKNLLCPKCKSHSVIYKRPIGKPFGKGIWKCYKCGHSGDYGAFNNAKRQPKRLKNGFRLSFKK